MKRIHIKYAADSDIGRRRNNNEDDYISQTFQNNPELLLLGAIDGVGGYEGGEKATEIAKNTIQAYCTQTLYDNSNLNFQKIIKEAVVEANNKIFEERQRDSKLSRMSCVVSVAILNKETQRLYYAHIGDSRGYVFRNNELIKFTSDDSLVGYLEESGELNEKEAMNHPRRNEITKLLGDSILKPDTEYIQSGVYSFYPNDFVLFCSDGLTDLVTSDSIREILSNKKPLEEKVQELIQRANDLGGKDNITVALAYNDDTVESKVDANFLEVVDANTTQIVDPEKVKTKKAKTSVAKKKKFNLLWLILPLIVMGVLIYFFKDVFSFATIKETPISNNDYKNSTETKPQLPLKIVLPDLPINYTYKSENKDGLARVESDGKFGFINKKDSLVIPLKYDYVEYFRNGYAKVKLYNRYGYINKKDSTVVPIEFTELLDIEGDSVYAKKDTVWSYVKLMEK